jgi:hypothetical protein
MVFGYRISLRTVIHFHTLISQSKSIALFIFKVVLWSTLDNQYLYNNINKK